MSRTDKAKSGPHVTTSDVMALLGKQYGLVEWNPRYDAASELVYTVLSQHTSDVNSERAFNNLMSTFGSIESVADARVEDIQETIRAGGLARIKAPRIKAILQQIRGEVGSFDLSFLREMSLEKAKAWLKKFDGIGPKTAAVILCFALGMPAMPVDTHIYRVTRRLGLIDGKTTADKAHDILEPLVAPGDIFAFHMYLIKHGRQTCKAFRPRCDQCVLARGCPSRHLFKQPTPQRSRKRPG